MFQLTKIMEFAPTRIISNYNKFTSSIATIPLMSGKNPGFNQANSISVISGKTPKRP